MLCSPTAKPPFEGALGALAGWLTAALHHCRSHRALFVIHGVGTGVVRKAVLERFRNHPMVQYLPPPFPPSFHPPPEIIALQQVRRPAASIGALPPDAMCRLRFAAQVDRIEAEEGSMGGCSIFYIK